MPAYYILIGFSGYDITVLPSEKSANELLTA